jgi:hypothetical protein
MNHYNRDLYLIQLESYKVRRILSFIHHVLDGQYFIDFIYFIYFTIHLKTNLLRLILIKFYKHFYFK